MIAESGDTVPIEGNRRFPMGEVGEEVLRPNETTTVCFDEQARRHGSEELRFVRVSIDEVPRIAERYGVMSIPTVLVINSAGGEIDRVVGLPSRMRLDELIGRARSSEVDA